eukprot:966956-Rhodomonas_salina.3
MRNAPGTEGRDHCCRHVTVHKLAVSRDPGRQTSPSAYEFLLRSLAAYYYGIVTTSTRNPGRVHSTEYCRDEKYQGTRVLRFNFQLEEGSFTARVTVTATVQWAG